MIKYGDVEEEGVYLDRFLAWMSKWMAVPFVNYSYRCNLDNEGCDKYSLEIINLRYSRNWIL